VGLISVLIIMMLQTLVVFWGWNLVIADVLSVADISIWQAIGLLLFSNVIFKSIPVQPVMVKQEIRKDVD
jgi:hypothetical protein